MSKGADGTWLPNDNSASVAVNAQAAGSGVAASVAENVTSFLNGIKASFRADNVYVATGVRSRSEKPKNKSHDV